MYLQKDRVRSACCTSNSLYGALLLLGNVLACLPVVVWWLAFLLVCGLANLSKKVSNLEQNLQSIILSFCLSSTLHLFIFTLILRNFVTLFLINSRATFLRRLGALLGVGSVAGLLGDLLTLLIVHRLAAFLGNLEVKIWIKCLFITSSSLQLCI